MRLGVIDIGSNTIKMTVFEIKARYEEIFSKTVHAKLSAHIENGKLTEKGIKILALAVNSLKRSARNFSCKKQNIFAFATACVRGAENRDEILFTAMKMTKIKIRLLSGKEEAELCFMGALSSNGCPSSGVLADLGGGSCEFISFENSKILEKVSLNIGALAMRKKFVSGKYISANELEELSEYLESELSCHADKIKMPNGGRFILTGGTARAAVKLISKLRGDDPSLPYTISLDPAKDICNKNASGELISIVESVVKERAETLASGLTVFIKASEMLGVDTFTVIGGGAREGFVKSIITEGK